MSREPGIWIIAGFAILVAVNMTMNVVNGLMGSIGPLNGVIDPNAFFGLSTAIIAASVFWAVATWRKQPNAFLGGAGLMAVAGMITIMAVLAPGTIFTAAYADTIVVRPGPLLIAIAGIAVLTLWTWSLTKQSEAR